MLSVYDKTRGWDAGHATAILAMLALAIHSTSAKASGQVMPDINPFGFWGTLFETPAPTARARYERVRMRSLDSFSPPPPIRRDFVIVIDASGSMASLLPFVINETQRVIDEIKPHHGLTLICFSGRGVYEVDSAVGWSGPRECTPAYKAEMRDWLTLSNYRYKQGGSGVVYAERAIVRAMGYEPDLVFLISDNLTGGGQGATPYEIDQDRLLGQIHRNNKAQPPTKINTIQFLKEDPLVRGGMKGTLDRIADETGGRHRYVSDRDLNFR